MSDGLDVIIVDDDPSVCDLIATIIKRFYTWGEILPFSDTNEAMNYCKSRDIGVAIFIVDVFLGGVSGFYFLDEVEERFPTAHSDAIIITGNASDDIVNMCIASDVNHLLEKPVKPYALQLAVRAIAEKYLKFAKRLFQDPDFAKNVSGI
ncbi:MAG: response regulator [Desulfatitalea sp.]|nr:response regulator [Desulfatitalea sp.]